MNTVVHPSGAESLGVNLEHAPIDFTRRFIAEDIPPLFHTPVYRSCPEAVQLRYNQLHAFYFNEQVAFFEQEMLSPALLALQQLALPEELASGLRDFFAEEQRHTAVFRDLNRRCFPELYQEREYYFVRISPALRWALRHISAMPRVFPFLVWLALLQEERSLHFSRACLREADDLEPHFVAMHRAHLADEVGHVGWDEELLDWLWPRTPALVRMWNARLLSWMMREFFLAPKRAGIRVVEQLAHEFPELDRHALRHAMGELTTNRVYLRTLYAPEVTPRSYARFALHPEFASLAQCLRG
jgi:hypothetical protein